jgi:hypothetical protein
LSIFYPQSPGIQNAEIRRARKTGGRGDAPPPPGPRRRDRQPSSIDAKILGKSRLFAEIPLKARDSRTTFQRRG